MKTKTIPKNTNSFLNTSGTIIVLFLFVTIGSSKADTSIGNPYKTTDVDEYNNVDLMPKVSSLYDCLPPTSLAIIQPTKSGVWNDGSIWPGGNLPTASDDVIIPQNRTVTLLGNCSARSVTVNGTLNARTEPNGEGITLTTKYIMVMGSQARLEIGTEKDPYMNSNGCAIILRGSNRNEKIPGTDVNSKAIMVMDGGTLELHGKPKVSWTNIATTASAGAKQITLQEAVDWEVGDEIVLTSTSPNWRQTDEATITAISGDGKTLTLASGLKNQHVGGEKTYTRTRDNKKWTARIYGEVALLSHNITIRGDNSSTGNGFGGHMMFMKNTTVHGENIELYRMGQQEIESRYPWHWHLNEDKAKGSYLKNSSIHKSYSRAVTIHGTDYTTVEGVVAYDHVGHGLFMEDGVEQFNVIKNNLFFSTKRPGKGVEALLTTDRLLPDQNRGPGTYWITNPNNIFEGNVAAGSQGTGFWFALAEGPIKLSASIPYYNNLKKAGSRPYELALGSFTDFVVHSSFNGVDVFDRTRVDGSHHSSGGWLPKEEQFLRNGLFYANEQAIYAGLAKGGGAPHLINFNNCIMTDNEVVTMLAANLTLEDCLFNADSDLKLHNEKRHFFRFYDGPGNHVNCHFEGWNRSNANMISDKSGGGATPNYNPTYKGSTKGFIGDANFGHKAIGKDTPLARVAQFFKDIDGGLLGKPSTTLVQDIPFNTDGHEYRPKAYTRAARSDYSFAGIWLRGYRDANAPVGIVRSKPGTDDVCAYDLIDKRIVSRYGLIVNEDFLYTFYLPKIENRKSLSIDMSRGDEGDIATMRYKGLGNLAGFSVSGGAIKKINSKSAFDKSNETSYHIAGNGDVYLKYEYTQNRSRISFKWNGRGSYKPVSLPCTSNKFTSIYPQTDTEIPNSAPVGNFMDSTVSELPEGYTDFLIEVDATDPDQDAITATLFIDGTEIRTEKEAPFQWGQVGSSNSGETLNLPVGEHLVEVVITDVRGASITISKTITVIDNALSVDEVNIDNTVSFYPNPVKNTLFVSTEYKGTLIRIYDVLGSLKMSKELKQGDNAIDIDTWPKGLYLLKAIHPENSTRTTVHKIIKNQ